MSDNPTDTFQNQNLNKTCTNCAKKKKKCRGRPGTRCMRCTKRNRNCIYPPRKERKKKAITTTSNSNNNNNNDNKNNNDNIMLTAMNLQTRETTAAVNNNSDSTSSTAPAVNTSQALITYSESGQPQTLIDPKLGGKFEIVSDGSGGYHLMFQQFFTPLNQTSPSDDYLVQSLGYAEVDKMVHGGDYGINTHNNDDDVDNVNNHDGFDGFDLTSQLFFTPLHQILSSDNYLVQSSDYAEFDNMVHDGGSGINTYNNDDDM